MDGFGGDGMAEQPQTGMGTSQSGVQSGAQSGAQRDPVLAAAVQAHKRGDFGRAIAGYTVLLGKTPENVDLLNNLGVALRSAGRFEAAEVCYRRVMALQETPSPGIHTNLGNVLRDQGRLQDAVAAHHRALELDAEHVPAWYGLALAFRDMGKVDQALEMLDRAISHDPANPDYLWDRALTLLQASRFEAGFRAYELRWRLPRHPARAMPMFTWDGAPFAGKTLLVYPEQGFGDMIQYSRFLPLLAEHGGEVVVQTRAELVDLFAAQNFAGVADVIVQEPDAPPPRADLCLAFMSLPAALKITGETIPSASYLTAPKRTLPIPKAPPAARLKVGIVWAGSRSHRNDHNRSVPFTRFLPLMADPRVAVYSLQKGEAEEQTLRASGMAALVHDAAGLLRDFADTAAVIDQLDLVITVDTAVAHLAGAMGKPVWVVLPWQCDWRYGLDDTATHLWYPCMRTFRQKSPNDWETVFGAVGKALAAHLDEGAPL